MNVAATLEFVAEVRENELVYHRSNKRCKPEALESFLMAGSEVKAALEGRIPS